MGVIPFEFTGGDNRKTLGLKGTEVILIDGLEGDFCRCRWSMPRSNMPMALEKKKIKLKARVDTRSRSNISKTAACCVQLRNLARKPDPQATNDENPANAGETRGL